MNGHSSAIRMLLATALGAVLLIGLFEPVPESGSLDVALADDVAADEIVLAASAQKHTRIKAGKVPGLPWVIVDVNPTLRGKRTYRVVLKTLHQGDWVRCTARRTERSHISPILGLDFGTGRALHQYAELNTSTCPGRASKPASKYRVVVRPAYGFARTVSDVQWVRQPSIQSRDNGEVMYPDYGQLWVDVNPTLPGERSYKVVVQRRVDGRWVRYEVARTLGVSCNSVFCAAWAGRNPHEVYATWVPLGRYRWVVPAQHGFARTVSTPVTLHYVP